MERARATWTDERLDDLSDKVENGFKRVDERFDAMEARLGGRIDAVEARLGGRIDAMETRLGSRIDGFQRSMIQLFGATFVGILGVVATVLAAT